METLLPHLEVRKLLKEEGHHLKFIFNLMEPGSSRRCQMETTVTKHKDLDMCLWTKHSGGWSRRIENRRPAWAIQGDCQSQQKYAKAEGLKYRGTDQVWHYVKCHRAHDKARHNVYSQKFTHKSKSLALLRQLIVLPAATLFMRLFYQHLISELEKKPWQTKSWHLKPYLQHTWLSVSANKMKMLRLYFYPKYTIASAL